MLFIFTYLNPTFLKSVKIKSLRLADYIYLINFTHGKPQQPNCAVLFLFFYFVLFFSYNKKWIEV